MVYSTEISLDGYSSAHAKLKQPPEDNAPGGRGLTVWFTGLSGAGKSTLASEVERRLRAAAIPVHTLDADVLRQGLCAGLGFTRQDRTENVRRIAEAALDLTRNGSVVLVAAIAPYRELRAAARATIGDYLEVWVHAPLAVCVARDPKGLYARAISGELPHFTGISDPYEEPEGAELELRTDKLDVAMCASAVMARVQQELALQTQYRGLRTGA
jgi:adenylylsulfate kinase